MREEQNIFDRDVYSEDVELYTESYGKILKITDDNLPNILEELEDGNSFTKGNRLYTKQDGNIYKQIIKNEEVQLEETTIDKILEETT